MRCLDNIISATLHLTCILVANSILTVSGTSYYTPNYMENNGFSCSTQTSSYVRDGRKFQSISIRGCGIDDYFVVEVPRNHEGLSVSNLNNCLIIGDPSGNNFLLYSDTPSTLVVMEDNTCVKKTYSTDRLGHVTSSSEDLSEAECDVIRQRAAGELEKNRIYWENWGRNFQQNMKNSFPSGFPFHNQQSTDNRDFSGSYNPLGEDWGKNFAANLKKTLGNVFRPGFPFNR